MAEQRLPIKIVQTRNEDFQRPEGTGGPRKIFEEETLPQLRQRLKGDIARIEAAFVTTFQEQPSVPAVARVKLKTDAIAKSHRPEGLLSTATPVIGVENFGELLVSVRPTGLRTLAARIEHEDTKVRRADISTIQTIQPYTEADALVGDLPALKSAAANEGVLKLRLFDHHDATLNAIVQKEFIKRVEALGLPAPERLPYGRAARIFKVQKVTPAAVEPLARFVGTQSISVFPRYHAIETASMALRGLQPNDCPPPEPGVVYPLVGIIDSGTNPADRFLAPWIISREEYVAPHERTYDHGSFVAGLIAQPRRLNQGDSRFPATSSKIVDVCAVPKGGLREDELLTILEEVLPKYPDVRIWNLSLGGDTCCDNRAFSDLAIKLDDLQDRYGVTFVLAAGNYDVLPLRGWPPEDLGEADRICSPADSLRGITVGSIAHLDRPTSRVQADHPSPFSRRGPGPVFVPKPEVVHLGGNCDDAGQYLQTGVMSVDEAGQLAENIGTSFAAPLVSTLLANVDQSLPQRANRNLLKALVIHSAMLESEKLTGEEIRYRGFGKPGGNPVDVLTCSPWSATLVFEPDLVEGIEFVRAAFPIPAAFRTADNKVRGGLVMTLVYDPPLDGSFGAEYCRTNIEASLGTYDVEKDGKRHHRRQIPPEPKDMAKLYEHQLIEHGFKWSPVKVYRRIIRNGIKGDEWRLSVSLTQRSGFSTTEAQKATILVTLFDPAKKAPIYNEIVMLIMQLGWATTNLDVQARLRT